MFPLSDEVRLQAWPLHAPFVERDTFLSACVGQSHCRRRAQPARPYRFVSFFLELKENMKMC